MIFNEVNCYTDRHLVPPKPDVGGTELHSCMDSYKEYDEGMNILARRLVDITIESLSVTDVDYFGKYLSGGHGLCRWNYYPACPEPQKALGMNVHTDFTLFIILQLGDVGGLQVQRGGRWIAVKPRNDAFAINNADMLEVIG